MGKVLLIISIVLTAASAALGFLNKNKADATAASLVQTEAQVVQKTASLEKSARELKTTQETLATETAEKELLLTEAESLKKDIAKNTSQITDLTAQATTKDSEIARLTADVEEKEAALAAAQAGGSPTEAAPTSEMQVKLQEQETLITKLQTDLDGSRAQLQNLLKEKQDRVALRMRNGLSGRILAVNQAWNFVVLNIGDKNGIVSNAEMLVKRGNQLVGKVRVTSVEPSTAIADIVSSSVPRGFAIQPGDNVIYQAVAE